MVWDYIIVGAGSAGCALAYELAKSGRNPSILVIEAGGSDRSPFIAIPAGQLRAIAGHDWGYKSQPDPSRNGLQENWQRGRVLGGSSSINGTMFVRGSATDFDRWAHNLDDASWSADRVMPIFRELETSDQESDSRGKNGPLHVRTVKYPHRITNAFVESARAAGVPFNRDYNGVSQDGVSYAQLSQRGGLRCSAADAFLKPLLRRKRVKLLLNAEVRKINVTASRAAGVTLLRAGKMRTEEAREIIICAGAINTPKLLMLSGVGDAQLLGQCGIETLNHLPGVGCNLRDHPLLRLSYETTIPTYSLSEGLMQKLGIAGRFALRREGPIANIFEAGAFLKSSPGEAHSDLQLHFLAVGYSTGPEGMIQLSRRPSVTVLLNKSHPKSSGRVRIASANPNDSPLIECRLLSDDSDVETLVNGVRMVRNIVATEPISRFIKSELMPGAGITDTAAIRDYVRANTGIAYHPVGTCRMGSDSGAVVGANLRVHGMENLWIADASIIPDLISGNTNAVCMMIGAKLGKQLAARPSP